MEKSERQEIINIPIVQLEIGGAYISGGNEIAYEYHGQRGKWIMPAGVEFTIFDTNDPRTLGIRLKNNVQFFLPIGLILEIGLNILQ